MFSIFKKHKFQSGALLDIRPQEKKEKDFRFEEIVSEIEPVHWVEKSNWRKFPIFDQNGSSACVAMSLAKILGIMHQVNQGEWINFSAGFIYQQRTNRPGRGMMAVDAWEIVRKTGCLLEDFFPSQNKTDEELDNYFVKNYEKEIASVFKISNYVALPTKNIDVVASTIQKTGKGVMVWFYFAIDEWDREVPIIKYPNLDLITAPGRHSVVAVDFTLYEGKKALIIDDSWGRGRGKDGQRIITEEFYRERNFYAGYPINFRFEEKTITKPQYRFERDLWYGMTNDFDVKMLQKCLKYLGYFPMNTEETGNYFEITRRAVYQFQIDYKVASNEELQQLQGKRVGTKTRAKLNELFS